MFPEIDETTLRFFLFMYLAVRLFYDVIYKFVRYLIGGGSK